jgi:hypothetical protein
MKNDKLQRIIELAKLADTLTNEQAKQFVELLVSLNKKQQEQFIVEFNQLLDNVSQETHRKIKEALGIISEKHYDLTLEVRQLTNKQKKAHEEQMLEAKNIITKLSSIEIKNGKDGKDGRDGKDGENGKDGKDGSPDTGEQVRDKLSSLEGDDRLDASAIKGLDYVKPNDLRNAINSIPRGGGGSGGIEVFNSTGKVGSGSGLKFIGSGISSITNDGRMTTVNLSGGGGGGSGDVAGPASATDNALARFDLTTGKIIKNSVGILSDAGALSGLTQFDTDNIRIDGNTISSTNTNGDISILPNGTGEVVMPTIRSSSSGGLIVKSNSGTVTADFGAGGGANTTLYGSAKMDFLTASKVVFTDASKNLTSTGIGTSSQFIKGDGSLDSSTYLTANQTITLSGDVTGSGTTSITTTIATGAVDIAMLSATGTPSASTYLRGDNTWATVSGSGDVAGPASSTDNALARFDSTTGKLIQNSVGILSDTGALSGLTQLDVDNIRIDGNTISSTDTNGNINLSPNGTGINVLANAQVTSLTASRVVVSDASDNLVSSSVTNTELDYVSGVTSAIQTQLNSKQKVITSGTAAPSGGSDGDIYLQYI